MKCPFCAEEIRNDAVLCRFCGAAREDAGWRPPPPGSRANARPSGRSGFTIRTAAVFFVVSAVAEGFYLTSAVPLFGALRGGAIAAFYHCVYVGLFLAMGVGLWAARPWGYRVMFGGTIFYSLDKLLYLFDRAAREAELRERLGNYRELASVLDRASLVQLMDLVTVLVLACWWGFLAYLYFNRDYFGER